MERAGRAAPVRRGPAATEHGGDEQLVYIGGSTAEGRAGRWVRQQPKTRAGIRSISISGFLAGQLEEQLANRSQPGRDGLVFVNMRGGPDGSSIFNKRH